LVEGDSMIGGSGGLGSTILSSLAQQVYQRFQKEDSNYSGGLDLSEVQEKIDTTGSGQEILDNFDSIDTDQSEELSATELIAFRAKSTEGRNELFGRLETLFQQSGISTGSIVDFLSDGSGQSDDLSSILQNATNLDALIESRVQEILTSTDEPPEAALLKFDTTI